MSQVTQFFQPPLYWQQFEDLTEGVFKVAFHDPLPTKIGSHGQRQDGVDVYGRLHSNGQQIGIQCKRLEDKVNAQSKPLPGGAITKKLLEDEINKALNFQPKLDVWILATTAKRDARIQKVARNLDVKHQKAGLFNIRLWFWDDYITYINSNYDLQRWYYDSVIQVRKPEDQDHIILELIAEAFRRPAFQVPIQLETSKEFIDALRDTQCALNTGELKDRITQRVIRKAVGGRTHISCAKANTLLRQSDTSLQELRAKFMEGLKNGTIIDSGTCLQITDSKLEKTLHTLRSDCVDKINIALHQAGLPPI